MKSDKLFKGVLKHVKPSLKEEKAILKEVDRFLKKINRELKKQGLKAYAVTGGSVAKGTFLTGDHDCDIFVRFDYFYKFKDISKLLGKVLKKCFKKIELLHGSRDYYKIKNKINYEIVPVLDIYNTEDAINITDCSPLHVQWVKKFPKLKNEIRLTKAFCKGIGVYGAESYIKGFSGHVVDIITINYGGFLKLLKASSKWKEPQVIDFYKVHKGRALQNLNKSKIQSPLIVIDPIQKDRNAAASLNKEKFDIFKQKAKEFLKKPSINFFERKIINIEDLKKKAGKNKLVLVDVVALKGKEDVIGAKILKCFDYLKIKLIKNDFKLLDSGWTWDKEKKAMLYFILDKRLLSEDFIREGPKLEQKEFVRAFKKKHKTTFTKGRGKRIHAKIIREFREPEDFLKFLFKEKYIKEKVEKIKLGDKY